MFRGDIIIDGYNLLFAAGLSVPVERPQALERSRQALLDVLNCGLAERERLRTTIVFDAPVRVMGPSPPQIIHSLRVLFADGDGDADTTIERLIQQNSAPRRLWVVSSDHRIQKAARRRRAKPLDSEDFLKRLVRRASRPLKPQEHEPDVKRSGRISPGEVDAWLKIFAIEATEIVERTLPAPRLLHPRPEATAAMSPGAETISPEALTGRADAAPPSLGEPFDSDEIAFWESRISELDREK